MGGAADGGFGGAVFVEDGDVGVVLAPVAEVGAVEGFAAEDDVVGGGVGGGSVVRRSRWLGVALRKVVGVVGAVSRSVMWRCPPVVRVPWRTVTVRSKSIP